MIGDKGREVIASSDKKSLQVRAYISLATKRHQPGELLCTNSDFRLTDFDYYIKYKTSANKSRKYKPFIVYADIFTYEGFTSCRVRDYQDFLEKAKTSPEFAFLAKYTNHSEEMFELAKINYHLPIRLAFDAVKYADEVIKNDPNGDKAKDVFMIRDLAEAERVRHEHYIEKFRKKEIKL